MAQGEVDDDERSQSLRSMSSTYSIKTAMVEDMKKVKRQKMGKEEAIQLANRRAATLKVYEEKIAEIGKELKALKQREEEISRKRKQDTERSEHQLQEARDRVQKLAQQLETKIKELGAVKRREKDLESQYRMTIARAVTAEKDATKATEILQAKETIEKQKPMVNRDNSKDAELTSNKIDGLMLSQQAQKELEHLRNQTVMLNLELKTMRKTSKKAITEQQIAIAEARAIKSRTEHEITNKEVELASIREVLSKTKEEAEATLRICQNTLEARNKELKEELNLAWQQTQQL